MATRFGQKFRYRFDSFMAKGGSSIFLSLFIVFVVIFFLLIIVRGLMIWLLPPDSLKTHHDVDFWGNVYITFLELTAASNMSQEIHSSPAHKVIAIVAGMSGLVFFSALIAFITTGLNQKINKLKRGHSKVIENGHTLILGWNEQRIVEIIRELVMANESEKNACIVILADKDKEMMDETLRMRVSDSKNTRLVTRSGKLSSLNNLDIVSVDTCRSVIILAHCLDSASGEDKASSDARVIQSILALTGAAPNSDYTIVAEIFNPTHRQIVQESFPDKVVIIDTNEILAKILVQSSRSIGLSVVYNEILSFDGCEMYFHHANWGDVTFGELAFRFPDGIPMGIRPKKGGLILNPPVETRIRSTDSILILAEDDSTIEYRKQPVAQPKAFTLSEKYLSQRIEKELILGWTSKAPTIIHEYSDYLKPGSKIHIMLKAPTEEEITMIKQCRDQLREAGSEIEIILNRRDKLNINDLMAVEPFLFDNIIILAEGNDSKDVQEIDSENIVTLLLLRDIFRKHQHEDIHANLITEVLDSQNYPLIAQAGVKDVIISSRLISMILAQVSEDSDIKLVYDDLFNEEGSEIYIKPADLYFDDLPSPKTYADLIAIAQKRKEVCLGLKLKDLETAKEKNFGIKLIPEKNATFLLSPQDSLVVLSEDEL